MKVQTLGPMRDYLSHAMRRAEVADKATAETFL